MDASEKVKVIHDFLDWRAESGASISLSVDLEKYERVLTLRDIADKIEREFPSESHALREAA